MAEPLLRVPDYYANVRPEMLGFLPDHFHRLLDVGCASGNFGALVKAKSNAEVWGVEPNAEAAQVAAKQLDRVLADPFRPDINLPHHYFDVITFNDSLEHLPYPEPALEFCKELLTPHGVVVCSVPNVRYFENIKKLLIEEDWEYVESGILDYTHLRFFTRKSIVRTFEHCGYHVEAVEGITPHPWSGWKIRTMQLVMGRHVADMKYLQFAVVARLQ